MSRKPVTITISGNLQDAVDLMLKKKVGSLIVVEDSKPVGMITERELIKELATYGQVRKDITLAEVMSRSFATVSPEASIAEAARTMIREKGRLIVMSGDRLSGLATASDLVRGFAREKLDVSIRATASPRVETLPQEASVRDAIQLMHGKRIGSVVVTKDGRPWGIFTERDILKKLLRRGLGLDVKLRQVATRKLVKATADITARKAALKMTRYKIKRLPLMEGQRLVGMVTARDLVEAFSKA